MFEYNAVVRRIVDGDTVVMDVDLGMHTWVRDVTVRMAGINAPESDTPEGPAATAALASFLTDGLPAVRIQTFKMARSEREQQDNWRRYLAIIRTLDADGVTWHDVNKQMLETNHATNAGYLPA